MSTRSTPPTRPTCFGPLEPDLLALRGIRLLAPPPEDGANGGGGDGGGDGDDGGNDGGGDSGGGNDGDSNPSDGDRRPAPKPKPRAKEPETFSREYVSELRTENGERRRNEGRLTQRAETAEQERDQARGRLAELERRDAIRDAAGEGGANARVLLDSGSFATATKELDLTDRTAVVAAIKKFVDDNPHAAAAPSGPGSSGPGRPGGPRTGAADTSNSLAGAVGAALGQQGVRT